MQFLGVKELERLHKIAAQVRLDNEAKEIKSVEPAYPLFSVMLSPTTPGRQSSEVWDFLYFGRTGALLRLERNYMTDMGYKYARVSK
jgi:hypothetical protein